MRKLIRVPDGTNVNAAMVHAGMSWWYRQYAPDDIALAKYEQDAQKAKSGLWSRPDAMPPWEFRRGGRSSSNPSSIAAHSPSAQSGGVNSSQPASSVASDAVYITPTREKYHRKSCRTISRSVLTEISIKDAEDKGYEACKVCRP